MIIKHTRLKIQKGENKFSPFLMVLGNGIEPSLALLRTGF